MRVVHEADGGEAVLATDVDLAESLAAQTKGLMFRSDVPEGYAMVFEFEQPRWRQALPLVADRPLNFIHMLFVRVPLDVVWLREGEVVKVATLHPWRGLGAARADTIIEFPAGAAADVAVGDRMRVAE